MSEVPLYPPLQRTPLETACSRRLNPEMCIGMSTSERRAKTKQVTATFVFDVVCVAVAALFKLS